MFWRVASEIRPAIASEPPEGSSTVDLACRFFRAGMLDARQDDGAVVGELAHLALDLEADAALRHDDGREGEADAELLVGDAELALAVDDRDRDTRRPPGSSPVSPETAVRFGSASVRMSPSRSSARSAPATD